MPKYIVKKIYKTVERVEVEADNAEDALAAAYCMDGDEIDYFLYDSSVKAVEE